MSVRFMYLKGFPVKGGFQIGRGKICGEKRLFVSQHERETLVTRNHYVIVSRYFFCARHFDLRALIG